MTNKKKQKKPKKTMNKLGLWCHTRRKVGINILSEQILCQKIDAKKQLNVAWLLKLNTKMGFNHHHHNQELFLIVLDSVRS